MHIFTKTKATKSTHCNGVSAASLRDATATSECRSGTAKLRVRVRTKVEDPSSLDLGSGMASSSLVVMGIAMVVVIGASLVVIA